ncbi:MFS transporter [Pseudomonas sp. RIT-PI-q]|uniref:MFS transporter n=1 Tax=Pseudomonas sp. RIT-PI-q TaxID=1690247 RepID=UPI0009E6656D|nr:MFS transporter [Pseudomonas sp. RIT-PI-q]
MSSHQKLLNIQEADRGLPSWVIFFLSVACGLIAANVYYAQPLIGLISVDLGLSMQSAGLIVTLTQLGYVAGLILLVPLADIFENRRLSLVVIGISVVALFAAAIATQVYTFLIASIFIGLGSVAVPILVPHAAHLVPEAVRGRTVGSLMSGMMLGIMLARPLSSFMADNGSWHVVFSCMAVVMVLLIVVLRLVMPRRQPNGSLSYSGLLCSMLTLARTTPILRRRALYQFFQFGAFTLFWTVVPLLLTGPVFNLTQTGVALFSVAGVAGVIAAPIAGRLADKGLTRPATGFGLIAVVFAFLITHIAEPGSTLSLTLLVVAAILLDFGTTATLVMGLRTIFTLGGEVRGRVNGVYLIIWYCGGAIGSAVGGWAYAQGGWALASWIGLLFPIIGLLYYATEIWQRKNS